MAPLHPFISKPRLDGWISSRSVENLGPKQTIASAALAAVHSINTPSSFQSFFSRDASRRRGKQPRSARVGSATATRHGGPRKASDSRPTPVGGIHTKQRKVIVSESIVDSGGALLTGSQRAWMAAAQKQSAPLSSSQPLRLLRRRT